MNKNTPKLWDDFWDGVSPQTSDIDIEIERKSISWENIQEVILSKFGSFNNLNVVEIGSGIGTNSILFAEKGANVTIVDYSKKALERSKKVFKSKNLNATFLQKDILKENIYDSFDVAMSFGLAEHFTSSDRIRILDTHFDLINDMGMTIISVPNKLSPLYMVWMKVSKISGRWQFGEETPFTPKEFSRYSTKRKYKFQIKYCSFIKSLELINPFHRLIKTNVKIKDESKSFLDKPFSYIITYFGENSYKTSEAKQ